MSRRKKQHEHVNHERWLVSYADFITLLFAFFVVLFSASQVDEAKVGRLALAVQVAFQPFGAFASSSAAVPLSPDSTGIPAEDVQLIENSVSTTSLGLIVPSSTGQAGQGGSRGLGELQMQLEAALAPEIARQDLSLESRGQDLILSLREIGFFDSGVSSLRPESEATMDRIAGILATRSNPFRIEGHTDSIPISTARYASNWELSTSRAVEVAKLLITRYGFDPARLSAAGYAEYRPVADNATVEGRALNRRVDIVIAGQGAPTLLSGDDALPEPVLEPERPVVGPPEPEI